MSTQLQPQVNVDFRDENYYFRKLFDMIWRLYDPPFDNPLLEDLQASMTIDLFFPLWHTMTVNAEKIRRELAWALQVPWQDSVCAGTLEWKRENNQ